MIFSDTIDTIFDRIIAQHSLEHLTEQPDGTLVPSDEADTLDLPDPDLIDTQDL